MGKLLVAALVVWLATASVGRTEDSTLPDATWREMQGVSWHADLPCPPRDALRLVQVPYRDFQGKLRQGALVVDAVLADEVQKIFAELAQEGSFRIERMQLIDVYGGNDFRSIEANNTSAFNCRLTTGAKTMSAHSKGRAIDINPLTNPYVDKSGTSHAGSKNLVTAKQRRKAKVPGLILPGSFVVKTFKKYGWHWGGEWTTIKDYQHFSKDGR